MVCIDDRPGSASSFAQTLLCVRRAGWLVGWLAGWLGAQGLDATFREGAFSDLLQLHLLHGQANHLSLVANTVSAPKSNTLRALNYRATVVNMSATS